MADPIKYLLDTNVLLDHILARAPFVAEADKILELTEAKEIVCAISMISIATSTYFGEKIYKGQQFRDHLKSLKTFCEILPADPLILDASLDSKFHDLEDAIKIKLLSRADAKLS